MSAQRPAPDAMTDGDERIWLDLTRQECLAVLEMHWTLPALQTSPASETSRHSETCFRVQRKVRAALNRKRHTVRFLGLEFRWSYGR